MELLRSQTPTTENRNGAGWGRVFWGQSQHQRTHLALTLANKGFLLAEFLTKTSERDGERDGEKHQKEMEKDI